MNTRKIVRLSMFLSLSIVLSLIEGMIPIFNNIIPGIKLGLANVVIVLVLYLYSFKEAIYVSIVRVLIVGLLRTGLFSIVFFFSLTGALFSIISMSLFKKLKLSIIGVSIVGSVFHSIGQVIVAILFLNNINVIYYLPYLLLFSIPTGIIVGIISKEVLKYYNKVGK